MHLSPAVVAPVPWHLGALHPYEHALTLVFAFGPFVLLGLVIAIRRRQDATYDEQQAREQAQEQAEPEREAQRDR